MSDNGRKPGQEQSPLATTDSKPMYPPTLSPASATSTPSTSVFDEAPAQPATSPKPRKPRYSLKTRLTHLGRRLNNGLEAMAATVLPICPNRGVAWETQVAGRTVRYYKHWPSDGKLIAAWDELCRNVPGSTVFQTPYWQQAIAIVPDALGTLRLVTVHDGDRLTGVFPLERRWGGHWRTTGLISTAYHDPILHPDDAAQTAEAALKGLAQLSAGALKSITLELLSPHSPAAGIVQAAAYPAGFSADLAITGTADTTVEFAPTWEQYLAKLDGHDRKELRRKIRKVEEKGGGKLVVHESEPAVLQALQQVLDLMEDDDPSKARKTKWLYRRHFEVAGPVLARSGRLVVYQLFVEDKLASSLISLPQGGHQLLWNGAMNAEMYQWSPGIALMGMIFRRAIERGEKSIDLLRGNFPYKFSLGAVEHPMHRLVLTRR